MNFDPNTGEPIYNQYVQPKRPKTNGFAIAGLVCSLLLSGLLGLIFSIVGLCNSRKCNSGRGLSTAGLVISIIKLIALGIVITFLCLIGASIGEYFGSDNAKDFLNDFKCTVVESCEATDDDEKAKCIYINSNDEEEELTCKKSIVESKLRSYKAPDASISNLNGEWKSQTSTMSFKITDNDIYWYKDYEDHDDNYWHGTYNLYRGAEAFRKANISEAEYKNRLSGTRLLNFNENNFFCLEVEYDSLISNGSNKDTGLEPGQKIKYMWIYNEYNGKVEFQVSNLYNQDIYYLKQI